VQEEGNGTGGWRSRADTSVIVKTNSPGGSDYGPWARVTSWAGNVMVSAWAWVQVWLHPGHCCAGFVARSP